MTKTNVHRPGADGLFGRQAYCGSTVDDEPDGTLRMDVAAYSCSACIAMSGEK